MAAIMALLMCTVITAANTGIDAGLPGRVLRAYALAMPVAFGCVLLVTAAGGPAGAAVRAFAGLRIGCRRDHRAVRH
jgi:Protein of unknown function (DUF2798).